MMVEGTDKTTLSTKWRSLRSSGSCERSLQSGVHMRYKEFWLHLVHDAIPGFLIYCSYGNDLVEQHASLQVSDMYLPINNRGNLHHDEPSSDQAEQISFDLHTDPQPI